MLVEAGENIYIYMFCLSQSKKSKQTQKQTNKELRLKKKIRQKNQFSLQISQILELLIILYLWGLFIRFLLSVNHTLDFFFFFVKYWASRRIPLLPVQKKDKGHLISQVILLQLILGSWRYSSHRAGNFSRSLFHDTFPRTHSCQTPDKEDPCLWRVGRMPNLKSVSLVKNASTLVLASWLKLNILLHDPSRAVQPGRFCLYYYCIKSLRIWALDC